MALAQDTDEELCALVRNGSHEAFGELWQRHYPEALGYAKKLDHSQAEDAVADVMSTVFADLLSGKGPKSSFRSYVLLSIRNRIYRGSRRDPADPLPEEHLLPSSEEVSDIELHENAQTVRAALQDLPERWREALVLSEIEGRSLAEIGHKLDIAPNAVSALLRRARAGLRRAWVSAHFSGAQLSDDCASAIEAFGDFRWGKPNAQQRTWFDEHMRACETCAEQRGAHTWLAEAVGLALLPLFWLGGARGSSVAAAARLSAQTGRSVAISAGVTVSVAVAVLTVSVLAAGIDRSPASSSDEAAQGAPSAATPQVSPQPNESEQSGVREDAQSDTPADETSRSAAAAETPPDSDAAESGSVADTTTSPVAPPLEAWTEAIGGGTLPGAILTFTLSDGRTVSTVADEAGTFSLTIEWNEAKPVFAYSLTDVSPG